MELEGRVAWITGGGRGIGRACAVRLAKAGASVAVTARTASELEEVVQACRREGARAFAVACDVTREQQVSDAHAAVVAGLGPPDILVPAAGVARSQAFARTDPDLMRMHWELNVMGVFHALRACLPTMVERRWGRVVAIASVAAKEGAPYIAAYAASKHGLLGLVRSVAAEVAAKGVTVNAVCPGYVNTSLTDENIQVIVKKTGMDASEARRRIEAQNPQGRLIEPEEVADLVAHLCGPNAQGINGQAINVDGGAVQW